VNLHFLRSAILMNQDRFGHMKLSPWSLLYSAARLDCAAWYFSISVVTAACDCAE
jgi:hypothetical protein